jgi:hypothetical protein
MAKRDQIPDPKDRRTAFKCDRFKKWNIEESS